MYIRVSLYVVNAYCELESHDVVLLQLNII